jgi:two-component system OmpR family response regulator
MRQTLLLVEDEKKIRSMLADHLLGEGFDVVEAGDGQEALDKWRESHPDLVILDIMLPLLSGTDVLKKIRAVDSTPVIMLTARSDEVDKLLGLELGADDYITKPFSPRELTARIRAVLRRTQPQENDSALTHFGGMTVDNTRYEAYLGDTLLVLTTTEFRILSLLAEYPGHVLSRLQLLERVFGDVYEGYERTIDTHISNLRRKMEATGFDGVQIKTVYGAGYKLVMGENTK